MKNNIPVAYMSIIHAQKRARNEKTNFETAYLLDCLEEQKATEKMIFVCLAPYSNLANGEKKRFITSEEAEDILTVWVLSENAEWVDWKHIAEVYLRKIDNGWTPI